MVTIIYASSRDGIIGRKDGTIPFRNSNDMKFFRSMTMNKKCIVGRVTAETLPPLKGRELIVMSRARPIDVNTDDGDIIIIGGKMIYELFEDVADVVYHTIFKSPIESMPGDVIYTYDPTGKSCAIMYEDDDIVIHKYF